mmetsp:Transcript_39164/g.123451  ORF Transcript_39164/g.123451 Transcript_39164/m.123451 type:complete len:297 (-) Transcript_39164:938-1828(-)
MLFLRLSSSTLSSSFSSFPDMTDPLLGTSNGEPAPLLSFLTPMLGRGTWCSRIASCSLSSLTSDRSSRMMFWYCSTCASSSTTFCTTLVLMSLALFAYLSVFTVSSYWLPAGDTLVIMTVRLFPPKESFSSRVSFESRYGTKLDRTRLRPFLPARAAASLSDARALMQFARARRDLLIFAPSTSRAPLLSVAEALSEPARSIKDSFPILTCSLMSAVFSFASIMICITACDREDVSFFLVGSTVRFRFPLCNSSIVSPTLVVLNSVIPATQIPFTGSSRRSRYPVLGFSRSRMFSL